MQHLNNVMVLGGEDKAVRSLMNIAVAELLEKHKGATAALYGNLGYIILMQQLERLCASLPWS